MRIHCLDILSVEKQRRNTTSSSIYIYDRKDIVSELLNRRSDPNVADTYVSQLSR